MLFDAVTYSMTNGGEGRVDSDEGSQVAQVTLTSPRKEEVAFTMPRPAVSTLLMAVGSLESHQVNTLVNRMADLRGEFSPLKWIREQMQGIGDE